MGSDSPRPDSRLGHAAVLWSQDVLLVDLRLDKTFAIAGPHRLTAILDVYNLFNSNSETNFSLRTGRNFRDIIAALDPRTFKVGVRWQF